MRYLCYIALCLLVVACAGESIQPPLPRPVKTTVVSSLRYVSRDFAALTIADEASNLAFKIGGRIVDIPVAKGQAVRRGQLLAALDDRDVRLQVDASSAAFNEAESRLARGRRLLSHNAISEQEVETLENSVAQARSAYNNALDMLADTRITAPFDGVVERTYADAFQRVASGETVVRIVTPLSTTVSFTAPENVIQLFSKPTTSFSVEFDAFPGVRFNAVMKSYARTSSDALGFPVSLRLTDVDTTKYRISPGMTCVATVITPESDRLATVVPLTAIYAPATGGDFVWVVGDDGRVSLRRVTLGGLVGSDSVSVLSGVVAGDRVVSAGVYHLTEGAMVKIIE